MDSNIIRKKFLKFFEEREHAVVPSSSLIPDDPSVLLTTAGMQQFKKYYTGEADPLATVHPSIGRPLGAKNAASIQKSFRTSDIDEVGDERHLTFFEMMGNFSFGGYGKERTIELAHEFLTKEMGLAISYVTVFEGKDSIGVPKDEESIAIWKRTAPGIKIIEQGMDDVFWGPTGTSGPCGPTTEIYVANGAGEDIEVWNCVFNQYFYPGSREELNAGVPGKKLEPLRIFGVDTGMGLERLAMVAQKTPTIFETDLFRVPFNTILTPVGGVDVESNRIIADHLRASVFLLADGVKPSNKGAGYILRRLLRRLLVHAKKLSIPSGLLTEGLRKVIREYGGFYSELEREKDGILDEFMAEEKKFSSTLERGLKEFDKRYPGMRAQTYIPGKPIEPFVLGQRVGEEAFDLYQSYGFPTEVVKELLEERFYEFDELTFQKKIDEEFKKHQEISRAGQEKKFGGHGLLLDTGELKAVDERELKIVTRLHTATHLLNAALRRVLGPGIEQQGSDITAERTRFDFTFPRKLTPDEIKKIEAWVNDAVRRDLPMTRVEMPYEEAVKTDAIRFSREKYPPVVNVYTVADPATGEVVSREFCGGPHVARTGEIGTFKILKEESSSAGIRRIRAVVE